MIPVPWLGLDIQIDLWDVERCAVFIVNNYLQAHLSGIGGPEGAD